MVAKKGLELLVSVALRIDVADTCARASYFLEVKDVELVSPEVAGEFVPEIVRVSVELEEGESHMVYDSIQSFRCLVFARH